MCKTNQNIKKELQKKLGKTKDPNVRQILMEKIKKLGDSDSIAK